MKQINLIKTIPSMGHLPDGENLSSFLFSFNFTTLENIESKWGFTVC